MRRQFNFHQLSVLALLLLLALTNFSISKTQDKKKNEQVPREGTPVMWREPSDIATRDLFLGSGGETLKPDLSSITLIEKEKGGWSTKYRVRDGSGREWVAKIGKEAQPETAAVRLMWGVGFFADIDYLVPSVRIEGLDKTLENVRFGARPKEIKRVDSWQWSNNPFMGKREFQGLKIMMAILDNWDIKDDNNTILAMRNDNGENELRYVVHDLGATFGKSEGAIWQKTRSRNDPAGYAKANFIDEVKNDRVDFHYHSKLNNLFDDITVEDAKWMGHWLSQLSDRQIEDAFRAANYSSEDVKLLAGAFRERIKELVELPLTEDHRNLINKNDPVANPARIDPDDGALGSAVTRVEETEGGTATPATPPSSPQTASPGLASRVKVFTRKGPKRESWTTINLGTKYANGIFGGFEQFGWPGLGVQVTTADLFRFAEFRATAFVSPNLYRRFEGEAYFPRVFDENTHADVWFDYLRRTKDNFFGIGPRIPNTSQTNFDLEQRSYNATLYHDFSRQIQVGGYFRVSNSATYKGQRDRDIPIDQLFSGDPNTVPIANFAPGLLSNAKILSYGAFAEYDLRNDSRGLTKGGYFYGRIASAQGLNDKNAFSDYGWLEGELDARGYIPLGSVKTSLALRGYASLKNPRGGSQIPFYDLSFLGGRMYLRGFKNFRFRGNNAVLGSAELRQTVWTQREDRGLDVFGFGDAGQVWGDNRSQTDPTILANKDFDSSNWRASVGGGLQYRYSRSLSGRIEIGHSFERNLIYASITRGF